MNSNNSQNFVVRYKFKGKDSIYVKILTFEQFENLKQDNDVEYSEIVNQLAKLVCMDYGFECSFVEEGNDISEVIEKFGKHTLDEHGIEYSKEAIMQFIIRQDNQIP